MGRNNATKLRPLQKRLHTIIYEADTPAGKTFDVWLLIFILCSVLAVMLESVESIGGKYLLFFNVLEWIFTILFTIEYAFRLYCIGKPWKYATSFYGVIDLMAILPTYLELLFVGGATPYFIMIRALRLLRVFRILKLAHYTKQSNIIFQSIRKSKDKIFVFLFFVVIVVMIMGSVMYVIEGQSNPSFSNIPTSIYWAIVTLTTVGYGDISPATPLGKFLAAALMILGYVVIAVPTGIVSAQLMKSEEDYKNTQSCPSCALEGHDTDAKYCKHCGSNLD